MSRSSLPTPPEIEAAAQAVYAAFGPTPQHRWATLSERLGTDDGLKHENHTPQRGRRRRRGQHCRCQG